MKRKIIVFALVILTLIILQNDIYAQKSKLLSAKVEYEYFLTESLERVNCNSFYSSFDKSKKVEIFKDNKKLIEISFLMKKFIKKDENLDVRGILTLYYKKHKLKYCFDRYGNFEKDGIVYHNKYLLKFLEKNIKLW